jgi:hypothetical protein
MQLMSMTFKLSAHLIMICRKHKEEATPHHPAASMAGDSARALITHSAAREPWL